MSERASESITRPEPLSPTPVVELIGIEKGFSKDNLAQYGNPAMPPLHYAMSFTAQREHRHRGVDLAPTQDALATDGLAFLRTLQEAG